MNKIKTILGRAFPLALGLALSIVMIARICFDLSYDKFYEDADRIYRIMTSSVRQGKADEYFNVSGGVAPGFRQYVPGVEEATRTTIPKATRSAPAGTSVWPTRPSSGSSRGRY